MPVRRVVVGLVGAATCFVLAALVHAALAAVMPGGYVLGAWYRMQLYHWVYPHQYIALVAVTYGLVLAVAPPALARARWWVRGAGVVGLMLGTVVLSSVPGGVLWKVHDMQAGYFPEGARLWADLAWGARTGFTTGWFVVLLAFPFNVVGLLLGFPVTLAALASISPGGRSSV